MLKRRGKIVRGLFVLASAFPAIGDFVSGVWASRRDNKWIVPLAVFLCLTGLLLVVAGTVEVLAPFIYTIF